MRVKAKKQFEVPGKPLFKAGELYNIPEDLAGVLMSRGLVEKAKKPSVKVEKDSKKEESKESDDSKKSKKSNK